jgi:hypothetical protein
LKTEERLFFIESGKSANRFSVGTMKNGTGKNKITWKHGSGFIVLNKNI